MRGVVYLSFDILEDVYEWWIERGLFERMQMILDVSSYRHI